MSSISGNFGAGFNPSQMMQGMAEKLKAADTDGNEAVSKQEFVNSMEESGLDTTKMDKMFSRMDANGDGEVSLQEQQDMMSIMEQRMGSLMGNGGGSQESFNSVETLLEALQSESDSDDEKQRLQDTLDKIRTEGYNESTMSESLSLINDVIPAVNTSA